MYRSTLKCKNYYLKERKSNFIFILIANKRIANLDISDPVRSAFDTLVTLHNYGQTNWWTEVTTLLQSLDISEPETLAAAPLKIRDKIWADLKEKIYDDHMKSCMTRIMDNTNGKLRTFLKFKKEYCQETYLLH